MKILQNLKKEIDVLEGKVLSKEIEITRLGELEGEERTRKMVALRKEINVLKKTCVDFLNYIVHFK
jgi:hypothetical protein